MLQKCLNFAVTPRRPPIEDLLSGVEKAIRSLPSEMAEEARQESVRIIKRANKPTDNLTGTERTALLSLKKNTDLTILTADKGNTTVIMNTTDYIQKMTSLLQDPSYRILPKDPTESTERKTTNFIKKSTLPVELSKKLCPTGSRPPRLY
jgi:hypothetical protein